MSNNTNLVAINSTLLLNKIGELSNSLKIISQGQGVGQTQEQLIVEANKLLSTFFNQLSGPLFKASIIQSDTIPDANDYNTNLSAILSDLNILFAELQNVSNIILSNFNFIVSDSNRLLAEIKSASSNLGNYILFSQDPNKDSLYFSDSFSNLNNIDFNSQFISTVQANIDQDQGIITLPISANGPVNVPLTISPVINNNSNGTPGNNYEAGAPLNNDITAILDDNADTWFEYEKVILNNFNNVQTTLILDITLNLGSAQVINYIRINPNNFGTKNSINIDTIETSVDGKTFVSIKEDIPQAGFINTDTLFTLSNASSKFTGQGIYSFTPRMSKFIHITFSQTTPYNILDSTGTVRNRYAIGIRDIEVDAIPYDNTGEIISNAYISDEEIKKVAIVSHQFPEIDIDLVSIEHYISPDDGLTWSQIEPNNISTINSTLPIEINYNTVDPDSINTSTSVKSLRYKAILKRNDSAFSNPTALNNNTIEHTSELRVAPTTSPFNIVLTNTPIQSTIKLIDPLFGSRGVANNRYIIGSGNNSALSFNLPFTNIKFDTTKVFVDGAWSIQNLDPQQIRINGIIWTRENLNSASSTSEIYQLDYKTGALQFGDNTNGMAVPLSSTIDIMFLPERLSPNSDDTHICTLNYPTSNDKSSFTVTRYGQKILTNEILDKGTTIFHLKYTGLDINDVIIFSDTAIFHSKVTFIDGNTELVSDGQYSIDYTNGIIYSKDATSTLSDTTIIYKYTDTLILDNTDWDFVANSNYTQITINDNSFLSLPILAEYIPIGVKYIVLSQFAILQKTLNFNGVNASTCFAKEVGFIDGKTELTTEVGTQESIGQLSIGVVVYTFRMPISAINTVVNFSNTTIFNTLVNSSSEVISQGQYFIDRSSNKITVLASNTTVITDAGTVNYYYNDGMKSNNGLYSVNYSTGEIFTSSLTTTGLTVDYHYSNFTAQYNIARIVDPNDFSYDQSSNTININEREILKRINLNKQGSTQTNYYQILYDKIEDNSEQLQALAPYFSPLLRDYALKVLPESGLLL